MNKTQQLSQYESQCCTYLPLGMETLNMLEYLSANEPDPFCSPVRNAEITGDWEGRRGAGGNLMCLLLGTCRSTGSRTRFQFERTLRSEFAAFESQGANEVLFRSKKALGEDH